MISLFFGPFLSNFINIIRFLSKIPGGIVNKTTCLLSFTLSKKLNEEESVRIQFNF